MGIFHDYIECFKFKIIKILQIFKLLNKPNRYENADRIFLSSADTLQPAIITKQLMKKKRFKLLNTFSRFNLKALLQSSLTPLRI